MTGLQCKRNRLEDSFLPVFYGWTSTWFVVCTSFVNDLMVPYEFSYPTLSIGLNNRK